MQWNTITMCLVFFFFNNFYCYIVKLYDKNSIQLNFQKSFPNFTTMSYKLIWQAIISKIIKHNMDCQFLFNYFTNYRLSHDFVTDFAVK
jgi:hypothetical protein